MVRFVPIDEFEKDKTLSQLEKGLLSLTRRPISCVYSSNYILKGSFLHQTGKKIIHLHTVAFCSHIQIVLTIGRSKRFKVQTLTSSISCAPDTTSILAVTHCCEMVQFFISLTRHILQALFTLSPFVRRTFI